jgi:poly(beta-D-mannuronate) lyase
LGSNGGETIRIGDSDTAHLSAKVVVENNSFERCNGEVETISNKSCDNVYRGNLFTQCSGTLTLRHGHRCLVTKNIFIGDKARGSGGVRIIGRDHVVTDNHFESLEGDRYRSGICVMNGIADSPANGYDPVERAIVQRNTFVECKRSIHFGGDNDDDTQVPPIDCEVVDNVIVSRRGPMIEVIDPRSLEPKSGNQFLGNQCFGNGEVGLDITKVVQRPQIDSIQETADSVRLQW